MLLDKHGSFENTSLITISQKAQVATGKKKSLDMRKKNFNVRTTSQLLEQVAEGGFFGFVSLLDSQNLTVWGPKQGDLSL